MSGRPERGERAAVTESAEELAEKSRLRSLFAARDEAADAIREASMREYELLYGGDGVTQLKAGELVDEHVRAAVCAYVLECEPLYQNTEVGREYWHGYELMPVSLPDEVPDELDGSPSRHGSHDMTPPREKEVIGVPDDILDEDKRRLTVDGIGTYVQLPSPIKVRWSGYTTTGPLATGDRPASVTVTPGVPRSLSEDVFRATNQLLSELDIGIDAEKASDDVASFDYSDLL